MTGYQIYLLDSGRCVQSCFHANCQADGDAVQQARTLIEMGGQVDVWLPGNCPDIVIGCLGSPTDRPVAALVRKAAREIDVPPGRMRLHWQRERA